MKFSLIFLKMFMSKTSTIQILFDQTKTNLSWLLSHSTPPKKFCMNLWQRWDQFFKKQKQKHNEKRTIIGMWVFWIRNDKNNRLIENSFHVFLMLLQEMHLQSWCNGGLCVLPFNFFVGAFQGCDFQSIHRSHEQSKSAHQSLFSCLDEKPSVAAISQKEVFFCWSDMINDSDPLSILSKAMQCKSNFERCEVWLEACNPPLQRRRLKLLSWSGESISASALNQEDNKSVLFTMKEAADKEATLNLLWQGAWQGGSAHSSLELLRKRMQWHELDHHWGHSTGREGVFCEHEFWWMTVGRFSQCSGGCLPMFVHQRRFSPNFRAKTQARLAQRKGARLFTMSLHLFIDGQFPQWVEPRSSPD